MSSILSINAHNNIAHRNVGGNSENNRNNQQNVLASKVQQAVQKSATAALNNVPSAPTNNAIIASGKNAKLSVYNNQASGTNITQTPRYNALSAFNSSSTSLSASGQQFSFKGAGINLSAQNATTSLFQNSFKSLDVQSTPKYLALSAYQSNSLSFYAQGGSFNLQA